MSAFDRAVPFDTLPIAAMIRRGESLVAVNPAYERLVGVRADQIVGRPITELIGRFVSIADVPLVGAAKIEQEGDAPDGELWVRLVDASGQSRAVRAEWHRRGEDVLIYLMDAEGEAAVRAASEGLARAAGQLGKCRDEREILERAADVLHSRGLIVTVLLLKDGDPLLEYGPMRSLGASRPSATAVELRGVRPRREVLWELNKDFHQRRAAFFQDVGPLIEAAYPGPLGPRIQAQVPQRRTVQAPLFVDDAPYGAFVLTGDSLNPALTGSLEMFAELVARAIENVRLRTELVQRERLVALGEAAAVMAHEVRNPVAAILNAGALLQKEALDAGAQRALRDVIGEEARRLDRLVSDLLNLGRPLTPRIRAVDLRDLARKSVGLLASRGHADVVDVVGAEPVVARIDPDLVQLALLNVVRNAVQASPAGRRVTIRAEVRGDRAALIVDDEGEGFPVDRVERILEPFHTTRATGTGIGLAVVRRVIEACAGGIEIGANERRGGRFVMLFARDA